MNMFNLYMFVKKSFEYRSITYCICQCLDFPYMDLHILLNQIHHFMLPRFCVWVSADVPWNLRRPLPSLYCFTGLNPTILFFFFKVFFSFLVILPRQKYAMARVFPQSNVLFGVGWDQCPIQNQVLKICGVACGWWNLGRLGSKRWWTGWLNWCNLKNIVPCEHCIVVENGDVDQEGKIRAAHKL